MSGICLQERESLPFLMTFADRGRYARRSRDRNGKRERTEGVGRRDDKQLPIQLTLLQNTPQHQCGSLSAVLRF